MFNNFNLSNEEIVKILSDYNPLIIDNSIIKHRIDEDLCQEIKTSIIAELLKNRKK